MTAVNSPVATLGVDPILLEIVEGTLAAIEKEVETAIGAHLALADDPRRARLPRRHPRPAAAQADRPLVLGARAPGGPRLPARDDARRATSSSTTTSTCPRAASATCPTCASRCRCSTTGRGRRVRAGVRPPRRHRRRRAPARCRRGATSVFEEGLMVPPIKLWDAGVPNEAALKIMTRNSPDARLAGRRPRRRVLGLPDGRPPARASCSTGTAATTVEALLRRDPRQHHRDLPARDPVEDPRRHVRLGGLRRARRRRRAAAAPPADHADQGLAADGGPLVIDFTGTAPAGQGPDQPLRRLRRRQLPEEVAGADPAQPRRDARSGWPSSTSTRASSR